MCWRERKREYERERAKGKLEGRKGERVQRLSYSENENGMCEIDWYFYGNLMISFLTGIIHGRIYSSFV